MLTKVEHTLELLLQLGNIGVDLGEGAELGGVVKVAGEADFVAPLAAAKNRYFTAEERMREASAFFFGRPPGAGREQFAVSWWGGLVV